MLDASPYRLVARIRKFTREASQQQLKVFAQAHLYFAGYPPIAHTNIMLKGCFVTVYRRERITW